MTVRKYVCVNKEYKYKYFFSKNSGRKKREKDLLKSEHISAKTQQ